MKAMLINAAILVALHRLSTGHPAIEAYIKRERGKASAR
jgi:hypothetical protein